MRVRFAPSPTGMFHVGGARSALFNWAVAQQSGGRFLLRIEDTDVARNSPEWTNQILESLAWIGIGAIDPAFEGPVFQSERAERHREATASLRTAGAAYYCACVPADVAARTGSRQRGYDGFCRDRGLEYAPGRALRFHTPDDGVTVVDDLIRGSIEFPNASLEDFVIARGDGSVPFLAANAVDDIDARITHVIRGEEHLSNAPKQQLVWVTLGAPLPAWAHLPVIVNERRQKLSKRRDKVALESYREEGYLAPAMINYLMLLGWGPRHNEEILPWVEIARRFRIEDVSSSSAFFDVNKLRAFNSNYIRSFSAAEFSAACQPWLTPPAAPWPAESFDRAVFDALAPLAQSRVVVLSEVPQMVEFAFLREVVYEQAAWDKAMRGAASRAVLADVAASLPATPWTVEGLRGLVESCGAARGLKLGKAQAPVRIAITGRSVGLPLFESMEVLGRDRSAQRLDRALALLVDADLGAGRQ